MKSFFSIVIPVYNVAPYLRVCLDSVLAQTFTDWEAVCVDDGSTDNSGCILDEYASRDSRFKVIHKNNGGLSSARNAALREVSGAYVVFLDSDDVINEKWLENLHLATFAGSIDCVRARWIEFEDEIDDIHLLRTTSSGIYRRIAFENLYSTLADEFVGAAMVCVGAFRREIVERFQFDETVKLREDAFYNISIFDSIKSLAISEYNGYLYRRRKSSLLGSSGFNERSFMTFLRAVERFAILNERLTREDGICSRSHLRLMTMMIHKDVVTWLVECMMLDRKKKFEMLKTVRNLYKRHLFDVNCLTVGARLRWKLALLTKSLNWLVLFRKV